jgi:pSer/pThr/pTyr-binding forkhead associated (FHA) protein
MSDFYLCADKDGQELPIANSISIGRSPDNDLVLTEGHPSRQHAKLYLQGNEPWLEDLGSANGTFVNDERIEAPRPLQPGDQLRFDVARWTLQTRLADDQATMLRPPDGQATVVRPPQPAATPTPPPTPEHKSPTPAAVAPAAAPRSWQQEDDGQGTRPLSPEELAEIRAGMSSASIESSDRPLLHVRSGTRSGETIELEGDNREWRIGSDDGADLCFRDENVSAEQAVLSVTNGRWKLADQFSKNRTFVNGQQANVSYLNSGDSIAFGAVQCAIALPATNSGAAPETTGLSKPVKATSWPLIAALGVATIILAGLLLWMRS